MSHQTFHYIKAYIRSEAETYRSQLLQILYDSSVFRLSVERLVYRFFHEDDYKLYASNQILQSKQYRIVLYLDGGNSIIKAGNRQDCAEGTLLLLSPGQQPSITPKSKGKFILIVFAFDLVDEKGRYLDLAFPELLGLYTGVQVQGDTIMHRTLEENQKEKLEDHFDRLYVLLSGYTPSPQADRLFIESLNPWRKGELMLQLFHSLQELFFTGIDKLSGPKPRNMENVRRFIQDNFHLLLSIDELARKANLSRTHFLYSFKKLYGISPIQYQLQFRMSAAKELLAGTSLSCKEISVRVGISNVYYFSKVFRNYIGLPPTEYRRKHQIW